MAPKKVPAKKSVPVDAEQQAAESAAAHVPDVPADVEIVEPVAQQRGGGDPKAVTFVLHHPAGHPVDDEGDDGDDDVDYDDEDDDYGDELAAAVNQIGQLLVTEDGEAVSDVLRGILDALDKQNKILYRGLQLLETKRR